MSQKTETKSLCLVPPRYSEDIQEAMSVFTNEINALKLVEESVELAAVIMQHYNDSSKPGNILEEIVGTLICMEQFLHNNYSEQQIQDTFEAQISRMKRHVMMRRNYLASINGNA